MARPPSRTAADVRRPMNRKHAAATATTATCTATVLTASRFPAVVVLRTIKTPYPSGQKRPEAAVLYQLEALYAIQNYVDLGRHAQ